MNETIEKSAAAKSKHWLLWLLATIALVVLVLFIRARVEFSWTVFGQQLKQADWRKFVIAISMIYGAYVLRSFRWAIFSASRETGVTVCADRFASHRIYGSRALWPA